MLSTGWRQALCTEVGILRNVQREMFREGSMKGRNGKWARICDIKGDSIVEGVRQTFGDVG